MEEPVLNSFLLDYYNAFQELNKRRQYGMAELPLLITEIYSYGDRQNFNFDIPFFYRAVTELDEEYMMHIVKARKAEADKQAKEESKKPKPNAKSQPVIQ